MWTGEKEPEHRAYNLLPGRAWSFPLEAFKEKKTRLGGGPGGAEAQQISDPVGMGEVPATCREQVVTAGNSRQLKPSGELLPEPRTGRKHRRGTRDPGRPHWAA